MDLTYNQFIILTAIERAKKKLSQRDISTITNLSLGTVNNNILYLKNNELIDNNYFITEKGLSILEPYRVKRAIFLAAGFGSRLVPITLETPKPLVFVNGKMMIETLLDAVIKTGIQEIVIVTGYLSDKFEILKNKYPNIRFIYNKNYNEANNISSAYVVKDLFQNAYVLESDLILYNQNLIRKYEYYSNFVGKWVDKTDDWCFDVKNNVIVNQKIGGTNCFQMYGICFLNSTDGKEMKKDVEMVYNMPGGKEKYWEQVMLSVFKDKYKIHVRNCQEGDIIEIDTFNELKLIDKSYENNEKVYKK